MSSTNRSNARLNHVSDYYVTPRGAIEDFLLQWAKADCQNLLWLDPCAGGDERHPMSYPYVINNTLGVAETNIHTIDIRKDSLAKTKGDFLSMNVEKQYDITITNPPFNIALDIIQKAFEVTKDGGYVIMLLRLNFLGSQQRKQFWDKYKPKRIYVHHRRMSFTEDGSTDSIEYAHFVWQVGNFDTDTILRVI